MDDKDIIGMIGRVDDKVNKSNESLARVETMISGIVSAQKRCDDHATRLKAVEEAHVADMAEKLTQRRIQGWVYAALCLGIPAITALVVVWIG